VVPEDRSEPKLAVANDVKLDRDLVRVEVSLEVVWEVLVDVGRISIAAFTATAVVLAMVCDGVACNVAALELATDGE